MLQPEGLDCLPGFALVAPGIEHKRFSPRTPQTKGTPRRFIQTPLREWVHVRAYETLSLHARRFPYRFPFWLHEYS